MVGKSLFYGAAFTAVELALYSLVFAALSIVIHGFSVADALVDGGYASLWRLWYLQVVLQVALLAALRFYETHENALLTVTASVVPLCVCTWAFIGRINALPKLFMVAAGPLSEGIVLILTVSLTWALFIKVFPRLFRGLEW